MPDLVLLSGGLDSTVNAALSAEAGTLGALLFVDYGQPAAREELRAAAAIAAWLGRDLSSTRIHLPTAGSLADGKAGVVAGRNLILLAHGVAWAASMGCDRVLIGATADDANDYPDCRGAWVHAANDLCSQAYGITVGAPLIWHFKPAVMAEAVRLGVPLAALWTCYTPVYGEPCKGCAACKRMATVMPVSAMTSNLSAEPA